MFRTGIFRLRVGILTWVQLVLPCCSPSQLGKQGVQLGGQLLGGLVLAWLGGVIRWGLAVLRQPQSLCLRLQLVQQLLHIRGYLVPCTTCQNTSSRKGEKGGGGRTVSCCLHSCCIQSCWLQCCCLQSCCLLSCSLQSCCLRLRHTELSLARQYPVSRLLGFSASQCRTAWVCSL